MLQGERPSGIPFTGPRATYVVLSAVSTLALALLISIWHGDFSGPIAVLGLVSIYIGSSELLALFGVLAPCSIIVDVVWLSTTDHGGHRGHGWLIFFTVLDMVSKVVGTIMAWSLHSSGEGGYAAINQDAHHAATSSPTSGAAPPTAYQPPAGFVPSNDPFNTYSPPGAHGGSGQAPYPPSSTYQPFPTSQAPALNL